MLWGHRGDIAESLHPGSHPQELPAALQDVFSLHLGRCLIPQRHRTGDSVSARAPWKGRDKLLWRLMVWRSVTHF